jgi:hypothetical protein
VIRKAVEDGSTSLDGEAGEKPPARARWYVLGVLAGVVGPGLGAQLGTMHFLASDIVAPRPRYVIFATATFIADCFRAAWDTLSHYPFLAAAFVVLVVASAVASQYFQPDRLQRTACGVIGGAVAALILSVVVCYFSLPSLWISGVLLEAGDRDKRFEDAGIFADRSASIWQDVYCSRLSCAGEPPAQTGIRFRRLRARFIVNVVVALAAMTYIILVFARRPTLPRHLTAMLCLLAGLQGAGVFCLYAQSDFGTRADWGVVSCADYSDKNLQAYMLVDGEWYALLYVLSPSPRPHRVQQPCTITGDRGPDVLGVHFANN